MTTQPEVTQARERLLLALENAMPLDTPDSVVVETLRNLEANGWYLIHPEGVRPLAAAQPSPDGLLREALREYLALDDELPTDGEIPHDWKPGEPIEKLTAETDAFDAKVRRFRELRALIDSQLAASPSGDRPQSEPYTTSGYRWSK